MFVCSTIQMALARYHISQINVPFLSSGSHYTIPNMVIVTFYVIFRPQWGRFRDRGTTQEVWITD